MQVPVLVSEEAMYGTGYFPTGRDQAYLCERDGLSLVGTAEVPLTALHSGEILAESDLPKRFFALSTCFRREAGAAGKDTSGLYAPVAQSTATTAQRCGSVGAGRSPPK